MDKGLLVIIGMCVLIGVGIGLFIVMLNDETYQQREKEIKSAMNYGCGGTSNDIRNCIMINQKLDSIIERLDEMEKTP